MILIFTKIVKAQFEDTANHSCLKCHSQQTYSYYNEYTDKQEKRLMNPYLILDTIAMSTGVHNFFDCTDCHSYEYTTWPHDGNLKLEPMLTCLDCHGGDESFASYQFEKIDEEAHKSIHYQTYGDNFTCSKCHDQHTYRPITRLSNSIVEIVEYSNNMCLSCHNDMKRFHLITDSDKPTVIDIHEWLPNQELHFKHVRCIECHTPIVDSLNISHNIMKKENAVRRCAECHSSNSMLKATLYKYQSLQERAEDGSVLGALSNESYVIGTHQIPILKTISLILFFAALGGIIIHVIFRIIIKK